MLNEVYEVLRVLGALVVIGGVLVSVGVYVAQVRDLRSRHTELRVEMTVMRKELRSDIQAIQRDLNNGIKKELAASAASAAASAHAAAESLSNLAGWLEKVDMKVDATSERVAKLEGHGAYCPRESRAEEHG